MTRRMSAMTSSFSLFFRSLFSSFNAEKPIINPDPDLDPHHLLTLCFSYRSKLRIITEDQQQAEGDSDADDEPAEPKQEHCSCPNSSGSYINRIRFWNYIDPDPHLKSGGLKRI